MSTIVEREGSEFTQYDGFSVEYRDASHRYWLHVADERTAAISVTSCLKVLDKPALIIWAERCGVEGALRLERLGELRNVPVEQAVEIVRINKMGTDAKRDAGADRGTAVHEALRLYCSEGTIPKVGEFPVEVRGYVSALCKWLVEASPEPILMETVVGSVEHLFAGRIDLLAMVDGKRTLCDLKTNPAARVYTEAHLQTAAYLLAMGECGIEDVDRAVIVATGESGDCQALPSCAEASDFLAVLACNRAVNRVRSSARNVEKSQTLALEKAA